MCLIMHDAIRVCTFERLAQCAMITALASWSVHPLVSVDKSAALTHSHWMLYRYTNRGRAYNPYAPTLGDSLNTAFLSAVYATIPSSEISSNMQFRLNCWSRSQVRYVLGDASRSLVSGWGHKPPTHVQVSRHMPCYLLPLFSRRVTSKQAC